MADEYLEFSTPTLTQRPRVLADAGDEGYAKSLEPRHVGMGVDGGSIGRWTIAALPLIAAVLGTGWVLSRRRLRRAAGTGE